MSSHLWSLKIRSYLENIHVEASAILPGEHSVVIVHLVARGTVVVGHVTARPACFPAGDDNDDDDERVKRV